MKTTRAKRTKARYGHKSIAMSFVLSLSGVGLMIFGVSTYQSDPEFIPPNSADNHKVVSSTEAIVAPPLGYSEPAHIHIPSLNIDSTITQVGKNRDNTMEVPMGEDMDKAAWYQNSSPPGQLGSSVIVGHSTNDKGRPSIFYELGKLAIGESVVIEREDGSTVEFEVTGREIHPRDDFPDDLVYGHQDEPSLRILTCGGMYNADLDQYSDNVIISAKLISSTQAITLNEFGDQAPMPNLIHYVVLSRNFLKVERESSLVQAHRTF